jgi:L-alanine-DL-glutamate epimerase-like enolase superfamily enzyme
LFGGAVRDRMPLYWSHCGSRRARSPELVGRPTPQSLDDIVALGREVRERGYGALKTNIIRFGPDATVGVHMPGFGQGSEHPQLNTTPALIGDAAELMTAFRQGAGPDAELMLDLNFNFRPEGYRRMIHALEPSSLAWAEVDLFDPSALARLRSAVGTPIASGESFFGQRGYRPFLEAGALDVAIIDVPWNGLLESLRIASLADAFEVNVAPHNFYGPLATLMSAQLCALVPNFRIMEIDVDDVPWIDSLVSTPPQIENGILRLSAAPGWGTEVNEEAVRAHPARRDLRSALGPGAG